MLRHERCCYKSRNLPRSRESRARGVAAGLRVAITLTPPSRRTYGAQSGSLLLLTGHGLVATFRRDRAVSVVAVVAWPHPPAARGQQGRGEGADENE
jgi:hypothetical protein